jgi:hypothetical protein
VKDEDILAFGPSAGFASLSPGGPAPAPRVPRLARWLLAGVLLAVLLSMAAGAAAWMLLADAATDGVHVTVNGQPWAGLDIDSDDALAGMLGAGMAVLALLAVVLFVVPAALLTALLAALLGLAVGLLAVLAVAAVMLSPLWLIVLLLWLILRRKRAPAARMAR